MERKTLGVLILIALSFSAIPLGLFTFVVAETPWVCPDYVPVDWESGLAGDVYMPTIEGSQLESNNYLGGLTTSGVVGDTEVDWYLEAIGNSVPTMTLRAQREFVEVWVADDLLYPEGDPRNDNPIDWNVTDEMCEYLADEFNDIIYQRDTDMFGYTNDRDGTNTIFEAYGFESYYYDWLPTDNGQKVILKVLNIRDAAYYDPDYPAYVAGFFSSTYNGYYSRNIIHIDNWRWWQRLGPEGFQWFPETNPELEVTRPNVYESTTAHEYQHNIHGDQLPGDLTYMNEACSLFAEPLCGYELDAGQIEWFLATPDNSLTQWGDQGDINILADYGAAFLWSLYLTDHYGFNFMGDYTQGGVTGIPGINALLESYNTDFYKVFHDWRLANLIQAEWGLYGYQLDELKAINPDAELNFDELEPLKIHEVSGKSFPWKVASEEFGETYTKGTNLVPEGYPTGYFNVGAFGTDYIHFKDFKGLEVLFFDGDDDTPVPGWTYDEIEDHWYSGEGDLYNTIISTEITVDSEDPTLTLTTYWDIEDYWDFGFVQISPDGGKWDSTWISLENEYTTYDHDPAAISTAVANLPGLTSWSGFLEGGPIITMTFDLSAYAGDTVHLGFRYVTDWATTYEGWYVMDVAVSGADVPLTNFNILYPEVDFMITIVERNECRCRHYQYYYYFIHDMWFKWDDTEYGFSSIFAQRNEDIFVLISPMIDIGYADYQFKAWTLCHRR